MSDRVTIDQQRKEEQNTMGLVRDNSPVSEELLRTLQWIQDTRSGFASSQTGGFWPNSNKTAVDATPLREGRSKAPDEGSSPGSKDTDATLESMTYVGGMNYAKYRLEASRTKNLAKQKKMRLPTFCMQDELDRYNAQSIRDGTTSIASSRKSSAYRAVEEAAAARTAMLQAEAEAQRALAQLADTRAECNEQRKVMTAELEAMQSSVKDSLRVTNQQHTVQCAKVDAMEYRLEKMKDLFLQRELRIEVQMAEFNTKMHTLSTATNGSDQPRADEHASSSSNVVPARTPDPPLTLKASPKAVTKVPQPPEVAKKHTKVHVCAPNSLSTVQLPPAALSLTQTQDRGVDPMTNTSSVKDLTDTKATARSQTSSVENDTYATAKLRTTGTGSMFLTSSEGVLAGNPCASSTRKKDNPNRDLSMQATKVSRDNSPAASNVGEVISPEQLRFTAALSKAMSKELAPLLLS